MPCTLPPARRLLCALLSLSFLLPSPVLASDLPDLGESARADLSPQMERKIGQQIMNQIRLNEPSYLDDPGVTDYLEQLGGRLVAASSEPNSDFVFFALRDASVNAFAMFGGHIGINSGTLLTAQSESELAGVMAHEIAHVTQHHLARQVQKQSQNSIVALAAMAVALLAARSNAQMAGAAIAMSDAAMIQSQLAFSRDFEREADRVGFEMLQRAGFDQQGMAGFFERLLHATRALENNAPVYLRSHPLTLDRITDMQHRHSRAGYRQVMDSLDFHLVRARLRAQQGTPGEALKEFSMLVRERKFVSETAARYGLALAQWRVGNAAAAQQTLDGLRQLPATAGAASPLIDDLRAEVRRLAGDFSGAVAIYREARQRFPQARALRYGQGETLLASGDHQATQKFASEMLATHGPDSRLYGLLARAEEALGHLSAGHRAQAEMYLLQGRLVPAIDQLERAQRAGGNFYEQSAVDARLRELKRRRMEEEREKKQSGRGP